MNTLRTEEEARVMVCPHLPVDYEAEPVNNVQVTRVCRFASCLASRCMMWRKVDQIGIGPNGERRDRDMDGRTRWVDRGYCGLASNPTPTSE